MNTLSNREGTVRLFGFAWAHCSAQLVPHLFDLPSDWNSHPHPCPALDLIDVPKSPIRGPVILKCPLERLTILGVTRCATRRCHAALTDIDHQTGPAGTFDLNAVHLIEIHQQLAFQGAHTVNRTKKAQPFPAGLWFVVVDVQGQVAIRSRRLQKLLDRPRVIRNASLHRGRDAQRFVNPHEVVPREVQAQRGPQILPLLAERVRQSGQAADLHPHREILPLDMRRADLVCQRR